MIHRILGATCGAALRSGHDYRPALDECAELGFNLVRVFAGRLAWCGQTADEARSRLPGFLNDAHARGLNVEVTANTDVDYDIVAHTREIGQMLTPYDLLEQANEPWNQGLSHDVLVNLPRPSGIPVALGAAQNDEAFDNGDASYVTVHLDRGRDPWNMVRRVRELEGVSGALGKPVLNNEPIGAGEADEPGKRESDPAVFYAMGALNVLVGVGGIFHSSDGLLAQRLGPNQRRCAEAFLNGARTIGPTPRLAYRNAGHDGSPIRSARFNDGDMNREGCTRAYSGIVGADGYSVAVGIAGDPGIEWNWASREVIGEYGGRVQVWHVRA